MSLLPVSAIPVVDTGYNINNSLRFRASANAYLNRTPASATNRTTWTWSGWVKRGLIGNDFQYLFDSNPSSTQEHALRFNANNTFQFVINNGGTDIVSLVTSQVFRDISSWYHFVVIYDSTQATSSNRIQIYCNGSIITSFTTATYPSLNLTGYINSASVHAIGRYQAGAARYFDGYMAEVNFIDGQALTPTSFGETNATTGVWQPKAYTGTYGTNGFYLKFSDATIGTPTLINTATAVQNTSSTTITVNVPAGTTNNDLMILVATTGVSTQTAPWTTPSGWTLWGNNGGRTVFYKTASSEPASYTLTHSVSSTLSACILTYRNAAIDVFGTYSANASPSDAPSITTTANNAVVFDYVAGRTNASQTYTTPTNFTPLLSDSDATAPSYAVFSRVQATAGATGTATTTPSSGSAMSVQFSIKPASTNLGKDFSGNNNLWATNNISITSGVTYDAMIDSPTLTSTTVANYCTANPLDASPSGTSVISNGNLTVNVSGSSAGGGFGGQARCNTINFTNVSGKWYWEAFIDNAGTGAATLRLTFFMAAEPINISAQGGPWTWYWRADGLTDLTSPGTFATNDVVMFAYDSDSGKLWVGKNGTWSNSGVPSAGTGQVRTITALAAYALGLNYGTSGGGTGTASFNFGQRPFAYTPPSGFNRINTFNLPTSTIVKGNSYMDATLYTGTGASLSVTNAAGFRPDFVWIKSRSGATDHALYDAVRGTTNDLVSNSSAAATTQAQGLTAFNSNGFTVGTLAKMNTNAATYVAWQWQAGSSTVTNTSGTISSQVRANTTTGFSIVTYTGTGANATVGHGLGVAPKFIIIKNRSTSVDWRGYHASIGATAAFGLNLTATPDTNIAYFNNTNPTSSVFSLGNGLSVNGSGNSMVAYCWAEIADFSRFGSYTGNGSTDGPFIYLGFRPKFVLIKVTSAANDWGLYDSSRNPINLAGLVLRPNTSGAEVNASNIDFLSNGFKLRNNAATTEYNGNGSTYIYAAFAENPFKNALAR